MIPYRPQSSLFDRLEPALMAVLLIIVVVAVANLIDASSVVAQKDMHIATLLDVKPPVALADQ